MYSECFEYGGQRFELRELMGGCWEVYTVLSIGARRVEVFALAGRCPRVSELRDLADKLVSAHGVRLAADKPFRWV